MYIPLSPSIAISSCVCILFHNSTSIYIYVSECVCVSLSICNWENGEWCFLSNDHHGNPSRPLRLPLRGTKVLPEPVSAPKGEGFTNPCVIFHRLFNTKPLFLEKNMQTDIVLYIYTYLHIDIHMYIYSVFPYICPHILKHSYVHIYVIICM